MNVAVAVDDEVRYEARPSASEAGPATKRIVVGYGFWIFLLSDIIGSRRHAVTYLAALITFVLGASFLALEVREFAGMIAIGAGPQRSAFLSAFFMLVGCHGLHVTAGLVWLAVMMAQVAIKGFRATVERRLLCFSLFWHALDIVWVWLFTVVYLMGVLS